jgi:amino acid adenylation domain-containing protein
VSRGAMVGVCCERHGDLVVALLGVLKAGAAYLPLDPGYPAERLRYMVADSGTRWLVGDRQSLADWANTGARSLVLEDLDDTGSLSADADTNADAELRADDIAYMIYTSGSTGRPKGVFVAHGAVAHFLDGTHEALEMQADDPYRCLAVAPVSFDISVLELFLPLCHGGTVVLADRETIRDGAELSALVSRHDINVLQATPVTWKLLRETGWTGQAGLRVIVGGEYVPDALGHWLASVGRIAWNGYGPTEATVYTHLKPFAREGRVLCETVSDLGGRLRHVQQRVVDRDGELAPIGGVGELWIGGPALAHGYWQREALTDEKFVERDLLGGVQRWYRTGDWVQQRHDGELRYLGRIDHQVKLRGHRIELGEIEQCLQALTEIADIVVDVHVPADGGEPQLAAYAVLAPGHATPDDATWRAQLQSQLPAYMHPSSLTVLEAMPLTASGKIDRKALPAPQQSAFAEHVAPEGEVEETLARIWSELLGLPSVGATANFFQLGGHSLLATRMVSMVGTRLGVRLPIKVVFDYPTIRDLGDWLEVGLMASTAGSAVQAPAADEALI